METEPAELDFDPYIGARKLNFRTVSSFRDENPAMSIFSMRGIRWFQRELLKRLIVLDAFSFGGLGIVFGLFLGCKNTPLDVSVLGGLASESAEMPEPEPAEPDFGAGTVGRPRNQLMSERDRTEPNPKFPEQRGTSIWFFIILFKERQVRQNRRKL